MLSPCSWHRRNIFIIIDDLNGVFATVATEVLGMILTNLSGVNKQESTCLIEHLIEYYRRQLVMVPSKERYIKKMLYMLNSLREPTDIEKLR